MSIQSWCQRAYIRCHPVESSKKKKVMIKMLIMVGKDGQDVGKERVTLYSSFKVVA
jgi:hypothetical protein